MGFELRMVNVVIAGEWNLAIFNPQWIASSILRQDPNIPLEVEVPLGHYAPFRVRTDHMVFLPDRSRVTFESQKLADLPFIKGYAINLLEELKVTPLGAVGVNLMFATSDPTIVLDTCLRSSFDDLDIGLPTCRRYLKRTWEVGDGELNLGIGELKDNQIQIDFNFHRPSRSVGDLIAWLKHEPAFFENPAQRILDKLS